MIGILRKATSNIDFMLNMAKEYSNGTGNPFDFEYDYGYHFEKRYKAMLREDRELTDLIYDCPESVKFNSGKAV